MGWMRWEWRRRVAWLAAVSMAVVVSSSETSVLSRAIEPVDHLADWSSQPKYVVLMGSSPSSKPGRKVSRTQRMTTPDGRKYVCTLPALPGSGNAESETPAPNTDHVSIEQTREIAIRKLRKAVGKKCMRKDAGFWTFELCPFTLARQVRIEGNVEILKFSIGGFKMDYWEKDGTYVQLFEGGTDGRTTKAVFSCATGERKSMPGVLTFTKAEEPEPFKYVLEVEAVIICLEPIEPVTSPFELLSSLNTNCIFLNKGWWSYEFCFLKSIKQLHTEKVKQSSIEGDDPNVIRFETVTTASFNLGTWAGDGKSPADIDAKTVLVASTHSPASSYFSQRYVGGTNCDLTQAQRETEVRFICTKDADTARFTSVKEISTCRYLIEIETPSVCAHPSFAIKEPVVEEIICRIAETVGSEGASDETIAPGVENVQRSTDTRKHEL